MGFDKRSFVAEKLWLLVAIVTLPLTALCAIAGGLLFAPLAALTPVVPIVGWFLLTPLLLLFGEEIAAMLYGTKAADTGVPPADAEDEPIAELKRRYAEGKIDDTEFERRLERLMAADEETADLEGVEQRSTNERERELER